MRHSTETVASLQAEVDRLRDYVEELEGLIFKPDQVVDLKQAFGLTKMEAKVVTFLMGRSFATRETIYDAIYAGQHGSWPNVDITKIFICKARRKLRPLGIEIETIWGEGWRISDQMKVRIWAYMPEAEQSSTVSTQAGRVQG